MIDAPNLMYTALSSDSTITSGGISVYGPPGIPKGFVVSANTKAISFWSSGGTQHRSLPISMFRYTFRCYAETHKKGHAIFKVLDEILSRKAHTRVTIGASTYVFQYGERIGGPYDLIEAQTEFHFVLAYYTMSFVERTVT